MDHLVYLDYKAKELNNLILGRKSIIVRGSMSKKVPYGNVKIGEQLYFVENKNVQNIKGKANVKSVFFSDELTKEDSFLLIDKYQNMSLLNTALKKKFAGKRYLTMITISDFQMLEDPMPIDNSAFVKTDDWHVLRSIDQLRKKQEA